VTFQAVEKKRWCGMDGLESWCNRKGSMRVTKGHGMTELFPTSPLVTV